MTNTDADTATSLSGIAERARALQSSVVGRIGAATESGKAMIDLRRTDRRRAELLQELGELHYLASQSGELDQAHADRLIAELGTIGAADEGDE